MKVFAKREGVFIDDTYACRAAAALMDYAKKGKLGPEDHTLFILTGANLYFFFN